MRVILVEVWGCCVRTPGRRPGLGGEGGISSSRSWQSPSPSSIEVWAGLSRARAIISVPRPGRITLKPDGLREATRYGPV